MRATLADAAAGAAQRCSKFEAADAAEPQSNRAKKPQTPRVPMDGHAWPPP